MLREHCPFCGAALTSWEAYRDVAYCALGHTVTGMVLASGRAERGVHLYEGRQSAVSELRDAVEAGFITKAEARLVALEMFPAAKKLADARALTAESSQA